MRIVGVVSRRVLRPGVRLLRRLAEGLDPADGNHSNPDMAYASINVALTRMMAEEPDVLRPMYSWGVLQGAHLARALSIPRMSVVEFGVAGGNGLVALERAAERVSELFGVGIDVYGFDTGCGLPRPSDYRDLPNLYSESDYRMDVDRLQRGLRNARLYLGLVEKTVREFLAARPAPVAFVSFDLDYYSSTMNAFEVLSADQSLLLPRVHCYFDDIMGFTCSEFTGERLAIDEFNASHPLRKISPIFGLKYFLPPRFASQQWAEMFYMAHVFDHPLYGLSDGLSVNSQRPLVRPPGL